MDILKIRALILGPGYICSLAKARLFVLYGVFDVWNGLIEALQFGLIKTYAYRLLYDTSRVVVMCIQN